MTLSSKIGTIRRETLAEREKQLTLLHQEILLKREMLLHTSGSYLRHSTRSASSTATISPAEASIRNAKLLKVDIENLNQDLEQELNSVPSPRFVTLQNNYWCMVRSLLPLWEQSLSGTSSSLSQQKGQQQQLHQQTTPHQGQRSQHRSKDKAKSVSYSRATK